MSLASDAIHFGFVTTVEIESMGLCGGLLLLNHVARPLEFHCTLPVKPSRSQEILFGVSLRPFLCSQVIGKALLEKSKTQPHVILTDCSDTLELFQCTDIPVAFHGQHGSQPNSFSNDWEALETGKQHVWLRRDPKVSQARSVHKWLENYGQNCEFSEPFERIKQAIFEAHQVARKAA